MTHLLERAVSELVKLPDDEQDAMAAILIEELAAEKRWTESFAKSQDKLAELAEDARRDLHAGRTTPLEPLDE
jgi:hypothetical protein